MRFFDATVTAATAAALLPCSTSGFVSHRAVSYSSARGRLVRPAPGSVAVRMQSAVPMEMPVTTESAKTEAAPKGTTAVTTITAASVAAEAAAAAGELDGPFAADSAAPYPGTMGPADALSGELSDRLRAWRSRGGGRPLMDAKQVSVARFSGCVTNRHRLLVAATIAAAIAATDVAIATFSPGPRPSHERKLDETTASMVAAEANVNTPNTMDGALRQFFGAGTPRFIVGMAFLTLGSRIALCFVHASTAAAATAATAATTAATASPSVSLFGAPALGGLAGLAGGAYPLSLSDAVVAGIVAMIWLVHEWWIHDKLLHSEQEWMGTDIHGFHHLLPYVVSRATPTTVATASSSRSSPAATPRHPTPTHPLPGFPSRRTLTHLHPCFPSQLLPREHRRPRTCSGLVHRRRRRRVRALPERRARSYRHVHLHGLRRRV